MRLSKRRRYEAHVYPTNVRRGTADELPMTILGMDHILLAMPADGEARARRFYGEMLGLTEVARPEPLTSRAGCWFEGPVRLSPLITRSRTSGASTSRIPLGIASNSCRMATAFGNTALIACLLSSDRACDRQKAVGCSQMTTSAVLPS